VIATVNNEVVVTIPVAAVPSDVHPATIDIFFNTALGFAQDTTDGVNTAAAEVTPQTATFIAKVDGAKAYIMGDGYSLSTNFDFQASYKLCIAQRTDFTNPKGYTKPDFVREVRRDRIED
jgi:hypothetical protein